MTNAAGGRSASESIAILTGVVVSALAIAVLYWAQSIFVPLTLALFFTFLLSPLVAFLQRAGLSRAPAVVLVVLFMALVAAAMVWLVTAQVTNLMTELPAYTDNIKGKIRSLQEFSESPTTRRFAEMLQEITGELSSPSPAEGMNDPSIVVTTKQPTAIVVRPQSPTGLAWLATYFHPLAESLAMGFLALVLLFFMLLNREDMRNRMIRLIGNGQITLTTKAVEDAGHRITRFLFMQAIVNGAYGLILAVGLLIIGVKYSLLWGFLAAVLRYIPYLGTWIAVTPMFALSLAQFEGWAQPLAVFGLFLVLELVCYNFVEPYLFGQSMGVSEVALLLAAAFWAFLWGPIGMVLSSPLTVCLVVLGRYVPQWQFLDVLLGDDPPLDSKVSFYQRLLARDQDEATELLLTEARESSPEQIYDAMLVPALVAAATDRSRGNLTEDDEKLVRKTMGEIVGDLDETIGKETDEETAVKPQSRGRILGCPARDEADELALTMLQKLLAPGRWDMEILSADLLTAEQLTQVAESDTAMICIGSLPPGGLAHTRYLCKRLRAQFPDVKIVVGRWGLQDQVSQNEEQLRRAGADLVTTTLLETSRQLNAWLPVLAQESDRSNPRDLETVAS